MKLAKLAANFRQLKSDSTSAENARSSEIEQLRTKLMQMEDDIQASSE
jgi:hypothetical protein